MDLLVVTLSTDKCIRGNFPAEQKVVLRCSCLMVILMSLAKVMLLLEEHVRDDAYATGSKIQKMHLSCSVPWNRNFVCALISFCNVFSRWPIIESVLQQCYGDALIDGRQGNDEHFPRMTLLDFRSKLISDADRIYQKYGRIVRAQGSGWHCAPSRERNDFWATEGKWLWPNFISYCDKRLTQKSDSIERE